MENTNKVKQKRARYYMRLSKMWGDSCYLCGLGFENLAIITKEHMVCISKAEPGNKGESNIAPAHYFCNQIKDNKSIIKTVNELNKLKQTLGLNNFYLKVNKIPKSYLKYRNFPFYAFLPLNLCYTYMVQRGIYYLDDNDFIKNEPVDNSCLIGFRKVIDQKNYKKQLTLDSTLMNTKLKQWMINNAFYF